MSGKITLQDGHVLCCTTSGEMLLPLKVGEAASHEGYEITLLDESGHVLVEVTEAENPEPVFFGGKKHPLLVEVAADQEFGLKGKSYRVLSRGKVIALPGNGAQVLPAQVARGGSKSRREKAHGKVEFSWRRKPLLWIALVSTSMVSGGLALFAGWHFDADAQAVPSVATASQPVEPVTSSKPELRGEEDSTSREVRKENFTTVAPDSDLEVPTPAARNEETNPESPVVETRTKAELQAAMQGVVSAEAEVESHNENRKAPEPQKRKISKLKKQKPKISKKSLPQWSKALNEMDFKLLGQLAPRHPKGKALARVTQQLLAVNVVDQPLEARQAGSATHWLRSCASILGKKGCLATAAGRKVATRVQRFLDRRVENLEASPDERAEAHGKLHQLVAFRSAQHSKALKAYEATLRQELQVALLKSGFAPDLCRKQIAQLQQQVHKRTGLARELKKQQSSCGS